MIVRNNLITHSILVPAAAVSGYVSQWDGNNVQNSEVFQFSVDVEILVVNDDSHESLKLDAGIPAGGVAKMKKTYINATFPSTIWVWDQLDSDSKFFLFSYFGENTNPNFQCCPM